MPIYLYLDRATALHRLHPAVKIIGLLVVFWSIYWLDRPLALVPIGIILLTAAQYSGSWSNFYRLRWLLLLIMFFTAATWIIFYRQGPPLVTVGRFSISRAALEFGCGRAFKLAELIAATILFLSTTRVEEFAYGLTWMGMPHRIGFAITLAFRLAPLFIDSALQVVAAQKLRGHDFSRGGPIARIRGYAPVMVPVFMSALRRANNMAMALEARGFGHISRPTSLIEYSFRLSDWLGVLALGALGGASFLAYLLGYGAINVGP
jgi:energy-coupling factor transport system permease protein